MPTAYSHSSLDTYRTCPQKYKFHYVDKVQIPRHLFAHLYLGTTVHKQLKIAYEWAADGKLYPLDRMLEDYRSAWEGEAARKIVSGREDRTVDDYFSMGERILAAYHKKYQPFNQAELFITEKRWTFQLPGCPAAFQAQLDRVLKTGENSFEICDYKTSSQPVAGPSAPGFINQMGMYQLAFERTFPENEGDPPRSIELVQHYLKQDQVIRYRMRPDEVEELAERFRSEVAQIAYAHRMDDWPATEGGHCRWCDFLSLCPAKRHRLQLEAEEEAEEPTTAGRAAELTDKYLELYVQKKELEAELEALKSDLVKAAVDLGVTKLEGAEGKVSVTVKTEEKLPTKTRDEDGLSAVTALVRSWNTDGAMEGCFKLDDKVVIELIRKGRLTEEQLRQVQPYLVDYRSTMVRAYPKKVEEVEPEE